jgi:hypothetical protein
MRDKASIPVPHSLVQHFLFVEKKKNQRTQCVTIIHFRIRILYIFVQTGSFLCRYVYRYLSSSLLIRTYKKQTGKFESYDFMRQMQYFESVRFLSRWTRSNFLESRIRADLHQGEKPDPAEPHKSKKSDPNLQQGKKPEAFPRSVEAHNRAAKAHNRAVKAHNRAGKAQPGAGKAQRGAKQVSRTA